MGKLDQLLGTSPDSEELARVLGATTGRQGGDGQEVFSNDEEVELDFSDTSLYEKWPEGKYLVEATDVVFTSSRGGDKMLKVELTCAAGPIKGAVRNEILMLEGNGKAKTLYFFAATGLYVRKTKHLVFKKPADVLGKLCWIEVIHEKQVSRKGNEFVADAIPFIEGFFPVKDEVGQLTFPLPANDPFAEPGQVGEAPKSSAPRQRTQPEPSKAVTTSPVVAEPIAAAPKW